MSTVGAETTATDEAVDLGLTPGASARETRKRPPLSLRIGFAWTFAATLVGGLAQFGLLMALTRLGGAEATGIYSYATALVGPILTLVGLQLRGLHVTDAREQFMFGDYLGVRLLTLLAAVPLIAVNIGWNATSAGVVLVSVAMAARLSLGAVADVFFALFQKFERFELAAHVGVATSVGSVGAFSLVLFLTRSLVASLVVSTLVSLLFLVGLQIPLARTLVIHEKRGKTLRPRFHRASMFSLIRLATPLGLIAFLNSLNSNIPRYFLAAAAGFSSLGIFFGLVSLFSVVDQFADAISQTISPRLGHLYARDQKPAFMRLLRNVELLAIGGSVVGVVVVAMAGPAVVSRLFSEEYGEHKTAMVILAVSAGVMVMNRFVGNAITAGRRLVAQVWGNAAGLVALIAGCMLLIPTHGIDGACGAVLLYSFVQLVANVLILARFLREWQSPEAQLAAVHA